VAELGPRFCTDAINNGSSGSSSNAVDVGVGPGVGIPSFLVAFVGVLLTIYYKRNKAERARLTAAALAQNSQCSGRRCRRLSRMMDTAGRFEIKYFKILLRSTDGRDGRNVCKTIIVSFACLDTPGRFSIIFFAHPQTSGFTTIRGRSPHPARDIPSRISRIEKTITVYLPTKKKHKGRAGK
jgi:hypothetical protein